MILIYHRTIKDKELRKLKEFKPGTWIDVIGPTKSEIKFLEKLGIEYSFIEDAMDPDELPRIEKEKNTIYIMLNVPQIDRGKILNIPVLIVISRNIFATISKRDLDSLNSLFSDSNLYTTQKTKNLLRVCLRATNLYTREIRKIDKEINTKKVSLSKLKNKDIITFIELEEILSGFVTSISALIGIFEKIRSGKYVEIFEKDEDLLEDLVIDSYQSLDMCKTSVKKIINIREAYSTILTNNLNKILKFLTSLTLIMGVPTIIASLYGMNVGLPFQESAFAFFYIFFFTLIISLILVLVFYLKKWL